MKKFYFCSNGNESLIIESETRVNFNGRWNSISGGYDSREILIQKTGLHGPCSCCKQLYSTNYSEHLKTRLITNNLCFTCDFWYGYIDKINNPKIARINGNHYIVESSNNDPARTRGFGGRTFIIRWNDGREVSTNNLWHQGHIPDRFKDKLPNNAIFIEIPEPIGHGQGFLS